MFNKVKKMSLFWKITLPILISFPLGIASLMYFVNKSTYKNTIESTVSSAINTIDQYKTLRGYYTKNIVKKVKVSDTPLKFSFEHKGIENTLPLPATVIHELSKKFSEKKDGVKLKLYSDFPFPNRRGRVLDAFQKDAIQFLKKNPDEVYSRSFTDSGNERVRVAIADKLVAKACVNCHNAHPQTPFNQWNLNDVRGILEVETPIQSQIAASSNMMNKITWFTGVFTIIFIMALISFLSKLSKKMVFISSNLKSNVDEALQDSQNVSKLANDMKEQTTVQASAIHNAVASLDEINSMVAKTSDNAEETKVLSQDSGIKVSEGQTAIQNMVSSMENINQSSSKIADEIQENSEKFQKIINIINEISEKTTVINDIVFQTKLLSFNASVEAARAGEHGKGFAVVAEEIGNLASMSGKSATEITENLDKSKKAVEEIIKETEKNVSVVIESAKKSVDEGVQNTQKCEKVFSSLVQNVNLVREKMDELTAATKEQSIGVQDITKTMNQFNLTSQNYSQSADKIDKFSKKMASQSRALSGTVYELEESILGDSNNSSSNSLDNHNNEGSKKAVSSKVVSIDRTSLNKRGYRKAASDSGSFSSSSERGSKKKNL